MGQAGRSRFWSWGCELEVGGSPVISVWTSTWGVNTGGSEGIGWGGINAVPVVVLDMDVVGKALNLVKIGLVLGLSSKGVRYRNWEWKGGQVDKREWEDGADGLPPKVGEFVLVGVTVSVDELEIVVKVCLELNFVELHFNFGLQQEKSG